MEPDFKYRGITFKIKYKSELGHQEAYSATWRGYTAYGPNALMAAMNCYKMINEDESESEIEV